MHGVLYEIFSNEDCTVKFDGGRFIIVDRADGIYLTKDQMAAIAIKVLKISDKKHKEQFFREWLKEFLED